ncbi:MAG: TetR/AcrR family transcriptional regulator [Actinomycetota bacterium]
MTRPNHLTRPNRPVTPVVVNDGGPESAHNRPRRERDDPAPRPSAVPRRKRTGTQVRNNEKLLDAMVADTDRYGLDDLRSARVSKAAGLTTGALYSRYENADEMLVGLWQHRVAERYLNFVRDAVRYVRSELPENDPVVHAVEEPTPLLRLGAEFCVVAPRNITVSEVITPAIVDLFAELGLTAECDPLEGAKVMIAASAATGTALRAIVTGTNPGWGAALRALRAAASRAERRSYTADLGDVAPDPINTGNPVRDALLISAKRVVANVGFQRATVSRIARRASLTQSAIYQLWDDKESMLDEAIREVSLLDYAQNSRAKTQAFANQRGDFGFTDSWYFGLMPSRRARLDFRLECVIASRYHKKTREELRRALQSSDVILQAAFPRLPHATTSSIVSMEQALGYGFTTLNKYAPTPGRLDYFSMMCALAKLGPLT